MKLPQIKQKRRKEEHHVENLQFSPPKLLNAANENIMEHDDDLRLTKITSERKEY